MVHLIPKKLPSTVSGGKNNFYKLLCACFFFFPDLKEKSQNDQDFIYLIYTLNLNCI